MKTAEEEDQFVLDALRKIIKIIKIGRIFKIWKNG
jgi:hypothetical protein